MKSQHIKISKDQQRNNKEACKRSAPIRSVSSGGSRWWWPVAEEADPWSLVAPIAVDADSVAAVVDMVLEKNQSLVVLLELGLDSPDCAISVVSSSWSPLPDSSSPLPEISSSMGTLPLAASLLCRTASKAKQVEAQSNMH